MPWSWLLCHAQAFGLEWRGSPLGTPHKWHAATEQERNQETKEGARGSSAVRQRNCQHWARPRDSSEEKAQRQTHPNAAGAISELESGTGNPLGPVYVPMRRFSTCADGSNERASGKRERWARPAADSEARKRPAGELLSGSRTHCPAAATQSVGSSHVSIIRRRTIAGFDATASQTFK